MCSIKDINDERGIPIRGQEIVEICFASNLRILRQNKQMSQSELAEMVGVERQTVSKWENGINEPDFNTVVRLCRLFEISIEAFLTEPIEEKS